MSGVEDCGFPDETSVRSCDALGQAYSQSACHLQVSEVAQILRYDSSAFRRAGEPYARV